MVEYSEILAYMKKMFPQKNNSELTKISYAIWKKGNIKDVSEIQLKKQPRTSKNKNYVPAKDIKAEPSALTISESELQLHKNKTESLKERAKTIAKSLTKKETKETTICSKTLSDKIRKTRKNHKIDHSYDDIIAESRGHYIYGTFICKRCGKIRHNGYKYKGSINICMLCRRDICGKTGGSVWAISTPMK